MREGVFEANSPEPPSWREYICLFSELFCSLMSYPFDVLAALATLFLQRLNFNQNHHSKQTKREPVVEIVWV